MDWLTIIVVVWLIGFGALGLFVWISPIIAIVLAETDKDAGAK